MLLVGAIIALVMVESANLIKQAQMPLKYQPSGITARWIPATVKHWQDPINKMAKKYDLDPNVIAIVMTLESGGYAKAGSSAGAQGLMQVIPPTAKEIAAKHLKQPRKTYDIGDPRINIEFGAAYLAYLRQEFGTANQAPSWDSTVELIAAGYNGGPGAANNLDQGKGLKYIETVAYSNDAFNMWRERHAANSPTYERWKERGGSRLIGAAEKSQR